MNDLPRSLVRFEAELEQAIRRDRRPRSTVRRPVVRLAIATGTAVAVALGVLSALPGNTPSVVQRAAAAVTGSADSILHVSAVVHDTGSGGDSAWQLESWQETSSPFVFRSLQIGPGNLRVETVTGNGSMQIYDLGTNTIYTNSTGAHELEDSSAAKSTGVAKQGPPPSTSGGEAGTKPSAPDATGDPYRGKILALLQSGDVAVSGHVIVDGHDALRLVSADGQTTIDVDPQTYRPIDFRTSDASGTETMSFQTYEDLPRNSANDALLSLTAQHPSARVDDSAADYLAAIARLGGKH